MREHGWKQGRKVTNEDNAVGKSTAVRGRGMCEEKITFIWNTCVLLNHGWNLGWGVTLVERGWQTQGNYFLFQTDVLIMALCWWNSIKKRFKMGYTVMGICSWEAEGKMIICNRRVSSLCALGAGRRVGLQLPEQVKGKAWLLLQQKMGRRDRLVQQEGRRKHVVEDVHMYLQMTPHKAKILTLICHIKEMFCSLL